MHHGHIIMAVECRTMRLEFLSASKVTPSRVFQAPARQDLGCFLESQLEDCETQIEMSKVYMVQTFWETINKFSPAHYSVVCFYFSKRYSLHVVPHQNIYICLSHHFGGMKLFFLTTILSVNVQEIKSNSTCPSCTYHYYQVTTNFSKLIPTPFPLYLKQILSLN